MMDELEKACASAKLALWYVTMETLRQTAGLKAWEWLDGQDSAGVTTPIFPTGMTAGGLGYVITGAFPEVRLSRVTMLARELTMRWDGTTRMSAGERDHAIGFRDE